MELSKELAQRAFSGISFRAESRGERECADFKNTILEINRKFTIAIEKNPEFKDKLIEKNQLVNNAVKKRWEAYLYSLSNVMSSMITGPARFPTERNRKRADWAHNKLTDLISFINRVDKIINRVTRVTQSIGDKLSIAKNNLELQIEFHELMKSSNSILKKDGLEKAVSFLREKRISEDVINVFSNVRGHNGWKYGFASFQLSNSLARINHTKTQIKAMESRKEMSSVVVNGINIEVNTEDDRIRIHFEGKPSPETIKDLKGNGFRWSPTNKAWQRQVTNVAMYKAKVICENLK